MILTAWNPLTDHLEKTYLSQAYAAGVTSVLVRNNNNIANNDRIMIGEMGRERTEIVTAGSPNADGVTQPVGATKFPHSADDPIYVLRYDQVKFYRSTTGSGGSYSILATVAVDVDNADLQTKYNDTTGLSSYYYKITYYHSIAAVESDFSDPIAATGYTRSQVGSVINDLFTEVGDPQQKFMTVPQAISIMNEVNDDLTTQSRRPYRFQKTSATLDIVGGTRTVALPTDLQKFHRIQYNYDFLGEDRTDNIRIIDIEEMDYLSWDNNALTDNNLLYLAVDETNNTLVMYPTPTDSQADFLRIFYWRTIASFDSLGDTMLTPTPRVYKLFLLSRFWRIRAVKENQYLGLADRYAQDYSTEVVKLQRMNKLDIGTPTGMRPDLLRARGLRKY